MIADLPRLHAVTDDRVAGDPALVARAVAMAEVAGPALAVHLRSRRLGGAGLLALARELRAGLSPHGSWLVVNGRADVARAAPADAIVLGRGALRAADARRVAPSALVLRSVHDQGEIRDAEGEGADALIAGSGFASPSHPGAIPAGPDLVRAAAARGKPVIAIGGLTPDRVAEALAAGAWGVAAIRALWDAGDPGDAAGAFLQQLPKQETIGVLINGDRRRVGRHVNLSGLLASLQLDARAVVVEHNRRIVRRDALDQVTVAEGDAIELVHFVGGG